MVFIQDGYLKTKSSQAQASKAVATEPDDLFTTEALSATPDEYGLLTDLYQLTMSACYVGEELHTKPASFELFTRRLPEGYGYLIAMGLEQGLRYLENLSFSAEQILQLQKTHIFSNAPDGFWALLENFRFEGDVWALPEGTAVFANEPMLRIEAPLWQAQIAETYLLNTLNYQTLIATRAARLRWAAGPEAKLYEFGTRRAFSPQGALWATRAAIAGGLDATSNVLAAIKLGRQPVGTMAHALVMAVSALEGSEDEGFEAFHRYFPGAPLLIDTYDTEAAAKRLAKKVKAGMSLGGVRIDSGDLAAGSKAVRSQLPNIPIFASGDLDEYAIEQLRAQNACIDGYGLGTKLVTGAPVNGVYKLVDIDGVPVMKESRGKFTYPGRKQIFRQYQGGKIIGDRLALTIESSVPFEGTAGSNALDSNALDSNASERSEEIPMLKRVMQSGKRLVAPESLDEIANRTAVTVAALPEAVRQLSNPAIFSVEISHGLSQLTARTRQQKSQNQNSPTGD